MSSGLPTATTHIVQQTDTSLLLLIATLTLISVLVSLVMAQGVDRPYLQRLTQAATLVAVPLLLACLVGLGGELVQRL
jgi:hypothetical protein